MENKLKKNLLPIILIIIIFVAGFYSVKFITGFIDPTQTKKQAVAEVAGVDTKIYDSIAKPKSSDAVIFDETGFGRENPFAPYK